EVDGISSRLRPQFLSINRAAKRNRRASKNQSGGVAVKIFLAGQWVDKAKKIDVRNPFDNSVIDTVPRADAEDLEKALAYAERGAKVMAKLSSYERWKILRKAADMMAARNEELGQLISKEEGKIIAEGRGEANRAVETIMGSAEEAKRLHGE